MLIREWMTKDVITVTPDTSMLKASKLMKDHNIRRLPVLDGKHVVGIVSDRGHPGRLSFQGDDARYARAVLSPFRSEGERHHDQRSGHGL